ncbi:MAG TPA: permease [Candidatus Aminicenantes bacterium]|nr:permease [Candidatus Aminicenantes bacterium]
MKYFLLALLWGTALIFSFFFFRDVYKRRHDYSRAPWAPLIGIGFVTNFFDTLGIGSFAPTTSFFKFGKLVDDRVIPGTLNVGHSLPTIAQALIFITVVQVAPLTLLSMMFAATLGAVLGAGVVSNLPVNKIRLGLGGALLLVAAAMLTGLLNLYPSGGNALGLTSWKLAVAMAVSFVLGSLMTIGIGIYAPCMALVFALGMNPRAAFPIMMGSAALLMPWCGLRFIKEAAYDPKAAFGLTALGVVGVLIAGYIVKSLPLTTLKWVIVAVIIYTSVTMFRAAGKKESAAAPPGN